MIYKLSTISLIILAITPMNTVPINPTNSPAVEHAEEILDKYGFSGIKIICGDDNQSKEKGAVYVNPQKKATPFELLLAAHEANDNTRFSTDPTTSAFKEKAVPATLWGAAGSILTIGAVYLAADSGSNGDIKSTIFYLLSTFFFTSKSAYRSLGYASGEDLNPVTKTVKSLSTADLQRSKTDGENGEAIQRELDYRKSREKPQSAPA